MRVDLYGSRSVREGQRVKKIVNERELERERERERGRERERERE